MDKPNCGGARSMAGRVDAILNVILVAGLWILLRALGVRIEATIVVVTISAVFGPQMLSVGIDRLRGRPDGRVSDHTNR
jgi:hypothetical protein